ncbi:hypothetical protein N2605_00240 [Bradyrhizobium yuanmingense]|uniref:hypothetical protein n=1 Tax=Bradyrhizobium yuanmingense TaxID=108015 RepID=UPI0021A2C281|nr:hypothetical protein [Bradyrhizobium sp. CB1024]UWU84929.1 hypothetical protein N2605_00240 [Bradyrhizobium sp. CB1024]
MYEEIAEGRFIKIERQSLYEADLRHERYDLDLARWSREWYWDAHQAASISFFRDPAISSAYDDDLYPVPEEDAAYEAHLALETAIDNLREEIIEVQRRGQLPDFFPPSMYLEWAKRTGVDFPGSVWHQVKSFEAEIADRGKEDEPSQEDVSQNAADAGNTKALGAKGREQVSLTKVILALFIRSVVKWDGDDLELVRRRVGNTNLKSLAKQLFDILEALDQRLDQRTIEKHLMSAAALLK